MALRSRVEARATRSVAQLANVDLNLLVILRELLRERNVTRAAERVAVTQPAASAALARLRRHFDDQLLVRTKDGYVLSPLAAQLAEHVELACAVAERVFAAGDDFEAATATQEFTLVMADYTVAILAEPLSQLFETVAPQANLHVRIARQALTLEAPDEIRRVDAIVAPPMSSLMLPHVRALELFRDRWVCVVGRSNREFDGEALTLEDLARLSWVVSYLPDRGRPVTAPLPQQLALLGIHPRVAVRVDSYLAVPYLVAGSDRVALVQARLAERLADQLDLRVLECPRETTEIVETLWWCEDHDEDPAHAWLRQTLQHVAAGI